MRRSIAVVVVLILLVGGALLWMNPGSGIEPAPDEVREVPQQLARPASKTSKAEPPRSRAVGRAEIRESTGTRDDDALVDSVSASFERQIEQFRRDLRRHRGPEGEGVLASLKSELEIADLSWTIARMEVSIALLEAGNYSKIAAGTRVPDAEHGFDRIVHGSEWVNGDRYEIVVFVPWKHSGCREARERYTTAFSSYWKAFMEDFNAAPLEVRRARILQHERARAQRSGDDQGMTPEEVEAALLRGPIRIDETTCTVSLPG